MAGIDECSAGIVGSITGTWSLGEPVSAAELNRRRDRFIDEGRGRKLKRESFWSLESSRERERAGEIDAGHGWD
jgi:hypothetical protein